MDGKSTRIARPPSGQQLIGVCAVQPSRCHCTPRFSGSIRSLSIFSFFFSLHIFIWARCSAYSATSFSGTMYLSENFLIASIPTDSFTFLKQLRLNLSSRLEVVPSHGFWWGLHSKKDNGSLVACHSRDIVVELELERW